MHNVKPEVYDNEMSPKKVRIYPTFRIGNDDLPEIKDMEVGKKYTLVIEVEVMSKVQGSEWNQNDTTKAKEINSTLKVLKVGCESDDTKEKPAKKPETRAEFEIRQGKVRNGGDGTRYNSKR